MTVTAVRFPVLETERLVLRAPGGDDVPAVLDFFGSARARFYGGPIGRAEAWRRFAGYAGQWMLRGYGFFAITARADGRTLGLAGPHHPVNYPEPEMAWLLTHPRDEGQGYALEAVTRVLAHLFGDRGWASVVSYIDPGNGRSRTLARRLGAVPESGTPVPIPGCQAYRLRPGATP